MRVEQQVEKITLDASLCKGGTIHFDCVSRIKVTYFFIVSCYYSIRYMYNNIKYNHIGIAIAA